MLKGKATCVVTEIGGKTSLETSDHRNGLVEVLGLQQEENKALLSERRVGEMRVRGYIPSVLTARSDRLPSRYRLTHMPTPAQMHIDMSHDVNSLLLTKI
jgi:hypothetical protein